MKTKLLIGMLVALLIISGCGWASFHSKGLFVHDDDLLSNGPRTKTYTDYNKDYVECVKETEESRKEYGGCRYDPFEFTEDGVLGFFWCLNVEENIIESCLEKRGWWRY